MANILTRQQEHERYCTRLPASSRSYCCEYHKMGVVGDVRRCDHGYLMLAYEVRGLIPPRWRTLNVIWTPVLYWRAHRALRDENMHFDLQCTKSDKL
jgi:hypothetical protein